MSTARSAPGARGSPQLTSALWCARRGWAVFPMQPQGKLPLRGCERCSPFLPGGTVPNPAYERHAGHSCPCHAEGRWCHGVLAATTNAEIITGWWRTEPRANVGLHTGRSHLVVIDVDAHGGNRPEAPAAFLPGRRLPEGCAPRTLVSGWDTLAVLAEVNHQPLPMVEPPTLAVLTPRAGLHLYYAVDPGSLWRQSNGALAWAVDVRAGDSHVPVPGTVVRAGCYLAQGDVKEPAALPTWLAAELRRTGHWPPPPRAPSLLPAPRSVSGGRGLVETVVTNALTAVANAADGERNRSLWVAGRSLGRLVGVGLMSESDAVALITEAGEQRGISRHEAKAQKTIAGGIEAGKREPFVPRDPRTARTRDRS
ncbi:bifunctional DNA primase/polymerase [Streptomyces sp. NPDC020379]|uniref:bifunctional DNA primase/polymerase n=1 Tax=Streptomyces sp. NPDC020379 TaxID=3365071 RepID=UPI00379516B1